MPRTEHNPERVKARKHAVQARSRATVEALLEGAAQVFERLGYAETTTDLIAERAGVSIGSLYQYFPNKDSILLALVYCHGAEAREVLGPIAELLLRNPPLEVALRKIVHLTVELNGRRPDLHRVLFHEAPLPEDFLAQMNAEAVQIAELLGGYLGSRPEATVKAPILAAHLMLASLGSLIHEFVIDPPPGFASEDCEEELFRLLHSYLTAGPR